MFPKKRLLFATLSLFLVWIIFLSPRKVPLRATEDKAAAVVHRNPFVDFAVLSTLGTVYRPRNNGTGFSIPDILTLCHHGKDLTITRFYAIEGPKSVLSGNYLGDCFPIEISTNQNARSMGHCSDFAQYIYHGGARLTTDHDDNTWTAKLNVCSRSYYLWGEYPRYSLFKGLQTARQLWMPNLEQIKTTEMELLPFAYRILCKYIANHTEARNLQAVYMSHSSPDALLDVVQLLTGKDKLDDTIHKQGALVLERDGSILKQDFNSFFHSYGHSGRKRTDQVYDCWRQHPEWPHLTIVGNRKPEDFGVDIPNMDDKPKNIHVCTKVNITFLRELQYKSGVHICPSQQEGYGHYINEARSMGALVFVKDGVNGVLIDH
ncbi:hypothetical protein BDR26DRAFT_852505 [Obelidium mucronatum]|nr:hypothetical protein BDR26DRAFT_852505 [Obelidium mucronatum]